MNNITEQLKEILGGVKDAVGESPWAQGFDDFMEGREALNDSGEYNAGFKYAKNLRKK